MKEKWIIRATDDPNLKKLWIKFLKNIKLKVDNNHLDYNPIPLENNWFKNKKHGLFKCKFQCPYCLKDYIFSITKVYNNYGSSPILGKPPE